MKKIMIVLSMALVFAGLSFGQTTPSKTKTAKTTKTTTTATTNAPGPKKKDGTADMRYKANKEAAKNSSTTTTHLTKSGKPDKRYKENKGK